MGLHVVLKDFKNNYVVLETEIGKPGLEVVRFLCVVNRVDKEVHEPGEGVLVHWLYVGQVGDGEE